MSITSKTMWEWECDFCSVIKETEYNSSPPKAWFDTKGKWNIFKTFCSKDCLENYLENEFVERNKTILDLYNEEALNTPPHEKQEREEN